MRRDDITVTVVDLNLSLGTFVKTLKSKRLQVYDTITYSTLTKNTNKNIEIKNNNNNQNNNISSISSGVDIHSSLVQYASAQRGIHDVLDKTIHSTTSLERSQNNKIEVSSSKKNSDLNYYHCVADNQSKITVQPLRNIESKRCIIS
jgi:hypothetical protein